MGCEHTRHCRDVGAASNLLECIHLHRKVSDRMKSFRLRRAARRPTCVRSAVASSQTAESDHLLTVLPVICWSYVPAVLVGRRRRLPADQARRECVTAQSSNRRAYRTDGPGGFWGSCQFFPHGTAREGNSEILNPRPTVHIRLHVYPAYNISLYIDASWPVIIPFTRIMQLYFYSFRGYVYLQGLGEQKRRLCSLFTRFGRAETY